MERKTSLQTTNSLQAHILLSSASTLCTLPSVSACLSKPRHVSSLATSVALNPWFVTGFSDAEACFRVSVIKNKNYKPGSVGEEGTKGGRGRLTSLPLSVRLYFQIGLHRKDEDILELIRLKLGAGKIYRSRSDSSDLQVSSFKDIGAVIAYFDKYPLITQKLADYLLFKQVFEMVANKEHLTVEGLKKIIAIKASINKGLPDELKEAYPDVEPVARCNIANKEIPDPN